jgi:hypothetical protein
MPRITKDNPLTNYISREEIARISKGIRTSAERTAKPKPVGPKPVTLKLTGDGPAVKARQRIEQTIALVTAQALLDAGFLLGVYDGGETTLRHSRSIEAVQAALFTTDEDYLLVYVDADQDDPLNVTLGEDVLSDHWVRLVYGNDGWDVLCDWCDGDVLEPFIGDGTAVQKLIDHASEFGTVPDLFYRNHKVTV